MSNFDSYYDAPDDFGDAVQSMIESLIEASDLYEVEDPLAYDEEHRKESVLLESLALMILDSESLRSEFMSHLCWINAGKPQRVNVYEENADLYDF